ncbi:hypothetical protein PANA5342_0706 [Pantoea ananatis LMG 5342]|nr:hypothetical protein PANA5342_0706 [Pantoea ananatis LMG 5342]
MPRAWLIRQQNGESGKKFTGSGRVILCGSQAA